MALLLPLVLIGGYYCPRLGFTLVALIAFFLFLSSKRGRFYCGWFCPMGAFHERILSKISLQRDILPVFKSSWFRWLLFSMMMGLMLFRLFAAWRDPKEIGAVLRMMWIVSMSLAIELRLYFKPKVWCSISPMGSLQGAAVKTPICSMQAATAGSVEHALRSARFKHTQVSLKTRGKCLALNACAALIAS